MFLLISANLSKAQRPNGQMGVPLVSRSSWAGPNRSCLGRFGQMIWDPNGALAQISHSIH